MGLNVPLWLPLFNTMKLNIFKYLITTVAAMSIVCSCDKDTPTTETPRAIGFNNVSTKATVSDLQMNGFGVWAFIDNETANRALIMNNTHVTYNSETASWEYSPLRYWVDDSEFTFVAVYPYDENGASYTLDAENASVKVSMSVSGTSEQEDYLITRSVINTSVEGYSETVDLQFNHILTSVGLNIWRDHGKHQNDHMRIRKVTLSNLRKAGTYSSQTNLWTPSNEKLTLEKTYEGGSEDDNIGAAKVKDDGTLETITRLMPASPFDYVMLIPQTIDASMVSLKILYELKRQNAADWEQLELETYLPATTWESNRRYTYNVVLSSVTDITVYYIQTKVDPWGTPQVGGTVSIK